MMMIMIKLIFCGRCTVIPHSVAVSPAVACLFHLLAARPTSTTATASSDLL